MLLYYICCAGLQVQFWILYLVWLAVLHVFFPKPKQKRWLHRKQCSAEELEEGLAAVKALVSPTEFVFDARITNSASRPAMFACSMPQRHMLKLVDAYEGLTPIVAAGNSSKLPPDLLAAAAEQWDNLGFYLLMSIEGFKEWAELVPAGTVQRWDDPRCRMKPPAWDDTCLCGKWGPSGRAAG
jgi:hypothetical protein